MKNKTKRNKIKEKSLARKSSAKSKAVKKNTDFTAKKAKRKNPYDKNKLRTGRGFGYTGAKKKAEYDKKAYGIFRSTRHGYGFVTTQASSEDIFIPANLTRGAMDGDRVEISYLVREGDRCEGEVIRITDYSKSNVIGTYYRTSERRASRHGMRRISFAGAYVIPDNGKPSAQIKVKPADFVRDGDKVEVKIDRRHIPGEEFFGEVIKNFGSADTREANYGAILSANGIETDFTDEELELAKRESQTSISFEGRKDFTEQMIFTIDGEDAKDLDDAVSLSSNKNGEYILGVHIADVSEYVKPKTALDRLAMRRGTSVYFTDKVVPMLPRALSNGSCSLNAGEKKYALSAIITLSSDGKIKETSIVRSVIISKVRGVYSEVNDLFENGIKSSFHSKYRDAYKTLLKMKKLYLILAKRAAQRGALELDRPEAYIKLDDRGEPIDIVKRERGDAEKMIEQFMLAANEGVATVMSEKHLPCVYRIHEAPSDEKTSAFVRFVYNQGLCGATSVPSGINGKFFADAVAKARETGKSDAVSYIALRTMAKARYSENNLGHFGLGIGRYCHFTSPIRRLSDLATHRMVKAVLLDGVPPERYTSYARRAAEAASEAELRAMSAERAIDDLYKSIYMEKFVGEEFDAQISMITSFGIFAALDNTCEGMIPVSDFGGGCIYDENSLTLYADGHRFSLADRIRIRVESTDITTGKVTFSLVGVTEADSDDDFGMTTR
ncbi:MAG: VacB/RNase II family 3'-5' exoribonuclease [Eubacteriales bacterium]|nr:VacB/RNase II family 3'-5' exoribonuclease [Eubacteriales bacterium]